MYTNIDQKLGNSLHGLLNCDIGWLDCRVITTNHRTCVHCIHMYHQMCNALVHVIFSRVFGQCSYTIFVLPFLYTIAYVSPNPSIVRNTLSRVTSPWIRVSRASNTCGRYIESMGWRMYFWLAIINTSPSVTSVHMKKTQISTRLTNTSFKVNTMTPVTYIHCSRHKRNGKRVFEAGVIRLGYFGYYGMAKKVS